MKKSSIKVDEDVWSEFKIACIKRKVEMQDALSEAIRAWVGKK